MSRLIDADALLKKTINNPLHVPYITKKDVIDMPSALNNQVNLCDSCTYTYPECPSEKDDVIFGNGIGNDNICACNKYQPTIQPVATDTNVGDNSEIPNSSDAVSRQAAIDLVRDVCDAVMSGCESWYDPETKDEVYKDIREVDAILKCNKEVRIALQNMPSAQPKQKLGKWVDDGDSLTWVCSECGYRVARYNNTPYCPNCGADMRGEQDE